ncbi:MAG: hypothetical protein SGPRY_011730, partial [Prymnesium sp.]
SAAYQLALKATEETLTSPPAALCSELAQLVQTDPSAGREALKAIKRRLAHSEERVAALGVELLSSLLQRCGTSLLLSCPPSDFTPSLLHLASLHPQLTERIAALLASFDHPELARASEQLAREAEGGDSQLEGLMPVADDPIPPVRSSTRGGSQGEARQSRQEAQREEARRREAEEAAEEEEQLQAKTPTRATAHLPSSLLGSPQRPNLH